MEFNQNLIGAEHIIDVLRDDQEYYEGKGKQYLSNSNIETLIKDPSKFLEPTIKTVDMLIGNYVHEIVFFNKSDIPYVDASNRNTKIYKDASEEYGGIMLLEKEAELGHRIRERLLQLEKASILFDSSNVYEEPQIGDLFGNGIMWKGKADIINTTINKVIDLKTTSNIDAFASKARLYNYDSQAWIYKKLFDLELMFFVIEKDSLRAKIVEVSEETLLKGKDKALEAEANYISMFKTKKSDPKQFVEYGII